MGQLSREFNLTQLANRYGSDKGTAVGNAHHYTLFYETLLAPRRENIRRMLEIGLLRNGPEVGASADRETGDLPSVRMWLDYFPNATVHGFDISDFSFFKNPRFVFTRGDSGNGADLDRVIANGEIFDFIIDDGSHASFHQQLAFLKLFPALERGGIYIIEDLNWQPDNYEESLPRTILTRELFEYWFRMGKFPDMPGWLAPLGELSRDIAIVQPLYQPFSDYRTMKSIVIQKHW
ncbi:hypothetical protein [Sphingomonas sp. PR090111-T3T-6A]|uniref:hypothetical protein n=1 Tax=Sphingomonas sp. PR090111-T3T-6A TaxID=685778 RepID=UPI0012FC3010|nr:hypothetical protein [Sphingomonas sp. PR090111-T3T-6A]